MLIFLELIVERHSDLKGLLISDIDLSSFTFPDIIRNTTYWKPRAAGNDLLICR
ncbi:MAG: hypothetical protein ACOC44_11360 [Promethearchaeia archaeon]